MPAREAIEQGNEARKKLYSSTRTMSGSPSACITRSQAGMRTTRVPAEKKPFSSATKGPADISDSPQIQTQKGLSAKGSYAAVATKPSSLQTPAMNPHEKVKNSRVAKPSTATPDFSEGNRVRIASSCRAQFSTLCTAHPVGEYCARSRLLHVPDG